MNAVPGLEVLDQALALSPVIYDVTGKIVSDALFPEEILDPAEFFGELTSGLTGNLNEKLQATLNRRSLGIRFGKFTDGRAYSLAIRLRELGYAGQLHALGDINQELLHHMLRLGFSHFHLPPTSPSAIDPAVLQPFRAHYQRTAIE
ncbi:MAG: DUF934 domain-containing protein [Burkholderiaceae bacterium]|nr:DUF934 domain-containing protein [Burkholderiaceae bacterium]